MDMMHTKDANGDIRVRKDTILTFSRVLRDIGNDVHRLQTQQTTMRDTIFKRIHQIADNLDRV